MMYGLSREQVNDDKIWKMIDQVKELTKGSYRSHADNAPTLIRLMEQILFRAKENNNWDLYFYAMVQFFWLIRLSRINDIHRSFQLSELFHRACMQDQREEVSAFAQEQQTDMAAKVLRFYLEYPQIDDIKIGQMLDIVQDYTQRYGRSWNNSGYSGVMRLALMNQDKQLAEIARRKLAKTDFETCCYTCYYGKPMLGYFVLHNDFEEIEDLISRISGRMIPEKHQWFYKRCENCEEVELVSIALESCLRYGNSRELFERIFARWRKLYQEPQQGEISDNRLVLFHALAGDWSREDECLRLAEKDDRKIRGNQETPLDCLYFALFWYCYFLMLDRRGVKSVKLQLGDGEGNADEEREPNGENDAGRMEWLCLNAAAYFERQADEIGAQMDKARKRFDYYRIKRMYRSCFLPV